jgi:hypothetical protein
VRGHVCLFGVLLCVTLTTECNSASGRVDLRIPAHINWSLLPPFEVGDPHDNTSKSHDNPY